MLFFFLPSGLWHLLPMCSHGLKGSKVDQDERSGYNQPWGVPLADEEEPRPWALASSCFITKSLSPYL